MKYPKEGQVRLSRQVCVCLCVGYVCLWCVFVFVCVCGVGLYLCCVCVKCVNFICLSFQKWMEGRYMEDKNRDVYDKQYAAEIAAEQELCAIIRRSITHITLNVHTLAVVLLEFMRDTRTHLLTTTRNTRTR